MAKDLSQAKCTLLTINYASEGNIKALHSFTPTRSDALEPEFIFRILLTYLPESLEPREYTTYVGEVASRLYLDYEREDVEVDLSPVQDLSEEQAEKKVKRLKLLEIRPPNFPPYAPDDILTRFLCHRTYRIDSETGLLSLVPQLVEPFLDRNDYLRTWYISVVLPLLRIEFEYYPADDSPSLGLSGFERLEGREGVDFLLQNEAGSRHTSRAVSGSQENEIARDIKGLVGPWMYGHTERKRRKLGHTSEAAPQDSELENLSNGLRKISLDGVKPGDKTGHDWEHLYRWLVLRARENLPLITLAVDEWDGPADIDLGTFDPRITDVYLDDETQRKLEAQYAQAAFACCYAAQTHAEETIRSAHTILARLAALLDFIPPPDLATSVDSLPKIEKHAAPLDNSHTLADLEPDALLSPEHPLTTPRFETYMLLQMILYSAYQLAGLGHAISMVNVAKLHFYASADEQLALLQRILRHLTKTGARKEDTQWVSDRAKLLWLWNWGIDQDDDGATSGAGVLGKVSRQAFEEEMLKCFTETSCKSFSSSRSSGPYSSLSVDEVDPVRNVETLGPSEEKDLSFPFKLSDQ